MEMRLPLLMSERISTFFPVLWSTQYCKRSSAAQPGSLYALTSCKPWLGWPIPAPTSNLQATGGMPL